MNNTFDYDYMIEILSALKGGKVIQRIDETTDMWIDHNEEELPKFDNYEYRIKPETLKYRVGLFMERDYYTLTASDDETANGWYHNDPTFIKWLTDWVEYEA